MVCGRLSVRLLKVRGHGDIMERKLEAKEHKSISTNILTVKMMQLTSWPLEGFPHPSAIISLINKLTSTLMSSSSKQTVIMCRYIHDLRPVTFDMNVCPQLSDGVVRSGTFLVIHSQLERLKTEGAVDVFQAIKSARIQRPGVIPNTVRMSATQYCQLLCCSTFPLPQRITTSSAMNFWLIMLRGWKLTTTLRPLCNAKSACNGGQHVEQNTTNHKQTNTKQQ